MIVPTNAGINDGSKTCGDVRCCPKKNVSRETNDICSDDQFWINLIAKERFKGRKSVFL